MKSFCLSLKHGVFFEMVLIYCVGENSCTDGHDEDSEGQVITVPLNLDGPGIDGYHHSELFPVLLKEVSQNRKVGDLSHVH